jgi:hypothetical protein
MDAARLQGDQRTATQGVLNKITNGSYSLAVTGVSMTALTDLASNTHVVSMEVGGSSSEIKDNLDTLYSLGTKVSTIQQSDSGHAIDVTQSTLEARASVLAKIDGGYSVNVSDVTANKVLADAVNSHVAKMTVADSGKNLASHWNALRAAGDTLDTVTKTDDGSLTLSVGQYLAGQNDQLLGKFGTDLKFSVFGASVVQAADLGSDDAVDKIDVTDDGSAVTAQLDDLGTLLTAGKLNSIALNNSATSLSLHASQLDSAQPVLDTIKGGHYTLAVDQVAAADAKDLFTSNTKIASMQVTGDAASIVQHLSDFTDIGHKLTSIDQTDADDTALAMSGSDFESNKGTLAKITGGYQADLSDVTASKAATFAASTYVKSLHLADTGANLASAWDTLGTLGSKVSEIAQSDSAALQLTVKQWTSGHDVGEKFSSALAVSVSGAAIADLSTLSADDAVTAIQVSDNASAIEDGLSALSAESKLTQIQITDPTTALTMSADTFGNSTGVLGLVKDGNYKVALTGVAVGDVATLGANSHVNSLSVTGTAADLATNFTALGLAAKVDSLSLSDEGGTLSLSAAQILNGGDTLAKISNTFQVAATGVTMANLAGIQAVDQVSTIGISDSAANVSDNFSDLLALGGSLSNLHLSDTTPVLELTQSDWTSGSAVLGKIDGSYHANLSEVAAADAQTLAGNAAVAQLSVSDNASNLATNWSSLIGLYNGGAGKLTALALTGTDPLSLTTQQQTDGAAMLTALLPDETIETAV